MTSYDFTPIFLTFKLAAITTLILFPIGLFAAYWLNFSKSKIKPVVEACITMPIVLPPVVLGFYLLMFFGNNSFLGKWLYAIFGIKLVFTFEGLVVASVIYSLPFMVGPLQSGFASIPISIIEASYTLGKSVWQTLLRVMLPNMKPAILTAIVLSFAHTLGEFGVVLMIGGSIAGKTKVASIAIYNEVQAFNYSAANFYALILLLLTFTILFCVYVFNRNFLSRHHD